MELETVGHSKGEQIKQGHAERVQSQSGQGHEDNLCDASDGVCTRTASKNPQTEGKGGLRWWASAPARKILERARSSGPTRAVSFFW